MARKFQIINWVPKRDEAGYGLLTVEADDARVEGSWVRFFNVVETTPDSDASGFLCAHQEETVAAFPNSPEAHFLGFFEIKE